MMRVAIARGTAEERNTLAKLYRCFAIKDEGR